MTQTTMIMIILVILTVIVTPACLHRTRAFRPRRHWSRDCGVQKLMKQATLRRLMASLKRRSLLQRWVWSTWLYTEGCLFEFYADKLLQYGLLPRDLRKIDSSNLPHILVRPSAILLNLLHLKVLIKYDRVLLFDLYGSQTSYSQHSFMKELQAKLKPVSSSSSSSSSSSAQSLPYEFRALEVVLTSVTAALETDFETVREPVMHVLGQLEDDIDRHRLRELLILSKRVSTFEQRAKLVRDAIDELLEAEDDLAAMYLTDRANKIVRGEEDHTEVEMLLESYHKLCDEIVQEAGNLVSGIRNTEEM